MKIGDVVLSRDESGGSVEAKRVTQTFEREVEETLRLTFANGEQIEATKEHPFYFEDQGFVPAGQLAIGTSIVTRAGPATKLTRIERKSQRTKVYNFEVADCHTYFVGKQDGGLWVHNDCRPFWWRAHEYFPQWITKKFGQVGVEAPPPNGPGPDAIIPREHIQTTGFQIAELKPDNPRGIEAGLEQLAQRLTEQGFVGPGGLFVYGRSSGGKLYIRLHATVIPQ